jgi:hypothetical protein
LDSVVPLIETGSLVSGVATVEHLSSCVYFQEESWTEIFSVRAETSSDLRGSRVAIETTRNVSSLSIISTTGSGALVYACLISINGPVEYSSATDLVDGHVVPEDKYDCSYFEMAHYDSPIRSLDYSLLPTDCFEGIDRPCSLSDDPIDFSCTDSEIAAVLAQEVLKDSIPALAEYLNQHKHTSNSSIIHRSSCQNSTESSWSEVITLYSTTSATTTSVVIIEQSPSFSAVSFLQLKIYSFGTSSVQYACYYVNGDELEFSSIVGGIVAGYTIAESQYNCNRYAMAGNGSGVANLTTSAKNQYYDLDNDTGLAIEYSIVCIYIVLSYMSAYKAYILHKMQQTRSDFKTSVNISFVVLFLVWASGNLIYMVLYSIVLSEASFFYIKTLLTMTYFLTYFGFILIVHYRYGLISS